VGAICAFSPVHPQPSRQGRTHEDRKKMNDSQTDPIAVTIPNALRLSGLGRTKLYELIAKREIQTARVGSRRLVLVESLRRFLASRAA
jgi:hypothetical protein